MWPWVLSGDAGVTVAGVCGSNQRLHPEQDPCWSAAHLHFASVFLPAHCLSVCHLPSNFVNYLIFSQTQLISLCRSRFSLLQIPRTLTTAPGLNIIASGSNHTVPVYPRVIQPWQLPHLTRQSTPLLQIFEQDLRSLTLLRKTYPVKFKQTNNKTKQEMVNESKKKNTDVGVRVWNPNEEWNF